MAYPHTVLYRFTVEDAEALLGRPLEEGESETIRDALDNSELGEVVHSVLDSLGGE